MTEHINVLELYLPEIAGRDPYQPPTRRLEKTGANAWGEVEGRRASRTLLVNQVRVAVDAWRAARHPGVTETTRRLLDYWFENDHRLANGQLFHNLPLIPPEWKSQFGLQVILRGDARDPGPEGNFFLTNIQQI